MQEESWQVADPAVVGHLGQQKRSGNVRLSWVMSTLQGELHGVTTSLSESEVLPPFKIPVHMCIC